MMTSVETCLRRGKRLLRRWSAHPKVRLGLQGLFLTGSGFVLSAASLMNRPQPLALGLTAALGGWQALAAGLGSLVGYRLFWGDAGWQGVAWALGGCLIALLVTSREEAREQPLLVPALCALTASVTGVAFQLLGNREEGLPVYLTRVVLGGASAGLYARVRRRGDPMADWLAEGTAVLSLSQIAPVSWLNLGALGAGALAVWGAFPAAALTGLGLDLARVTAVPMTAVLCTAYLTRLLPGKSRWIRCLAPPGSCIVIMGLCGTWDITLLPGLLAGGVVGMLLPRSVALHHRRGETGLAQVRLELSARILEQTRALLLETRSPPPDREAVLEKVRLNACENCGSRKACTFREEMTAELLSNPMEKLCRKPGRLIPELRRGQEQLRQMAADRQRREEYRQALLQQYQFLSDYLRDLADRLPRRGERVYTAFRVSCAARSRGKELQNGDRCMAFPGTAGRYYVALCDGMGTGPGASGEGESAARLLRQLLTIGYPAEHALRSVNSLLALRGKAGAVTMDLAELNLTTGAAVLYKWGAAPSWVLKKGGAEKVGTATPPPGITVENARETVLRLSLRRGEVLILLSDGVEAGETLGRMELTPGAEPGKLAQELLERGCRGQDDATAAVIRLTPLRPLSS